MSLEDQWRRIEASLPEEWADAQLALEVPNPVQRARAAALLGPANPGPRGVTSSASPRIAAARAPARRPFGVSCGGSTTPGSGASSASSTRTEIPPEAEVDRAGLAPAWDALANGLPPDWSDLLCEIDLTSSDYLQRAALLLAPVNPARTGAAGASASASPGASATAPRPR